MKSIEDLEQMTVPQLKSIATDLGASVDPKIKKADLVQLVHTIQQPEPEEPVEDDNETPVDEDKPITTNDEFEVHKQAVVDFFDGTDLIEAGETPDGVVIYAVVDELTEEEVVRGTFLQLEDRMMNDPNEPVDLDKEGKDEPQFEPPAVEDRVLETPAIENEDALEAIEHGLEPMRALGLKTEIDGSTIKFRYGSKTSTTTLNQPAHRVVKVAEVLCKFR